MGKEEFNLKQLSLENTKFKRYISSEHKIVQQSLQIEDYDFLCFLFTSCWVHKTLVDKLYAEMAEIVEQGSHYIGKKCAVVFISLDHVSVVISAPVSRKIHFSFPTKSQKKRCWKHWKVSLGTCVLIHSNITRNALPWQKGIFYPFRFPITWNFESNFQCAMRSTSRPCRSCEEQGWFILHWASMVWRCKYWYDIVDDLVVILLLFFFSDIMKRILAPVEERDSN